jgi:hypothetical protein
MRDQRRHVKTGLTRKTLAGLSLGLAGGYFVVGLWPFDFRPVNKVTWRTDRSGLHFEPNAIACVRDSEPRQPGSDSESRPANFTIELLLQAGLGTTSDLLHILTLDDGRLPPDFALCQWNSEFLLRTTSIIHPSSGRIREINFPGAFAKNKTRFICVTGNESGIDFYLDDFPPERVPKFIVDANVLHGQLILGNTVSGKHSWTGDLFGLAVFDRALSAAEIARHYAAWTNGNARQLIREPGLSALYLFDEGRGSQVRDHSANRRDLMIPAVYFVPHKEVLISPWRDLAFDLSHPSDIFLNILGFVPFGFCFFLYRRQAGPRRWINDVLLVLLSGFAISLAIELIQVWLPNRVSSATDLLSNTTGTLLGVAAALLLRRNWVRA